MRIVTDIVVGVFIVFIVLPFILLCSLLMINVMLEIFHDLKEDVQELLNGKKKR